MKALILCVLIEIEGWKRSLRGGEMPHLKHWKSRSTSSIWFAFVFLFYDTSVFQGGGLFDSEMYRFSIAAVREKWIFWRKCWKDKTTPNLEGNLLNESETEIIRPLKLYIILILKLQVFFFFYTFGRLNFKVIISIFVIINW